jgi:hypothetical protein
MRIVDGDRFGSQLGLQAAAVKCYGVELVRAVAGRAGAAGIRKDVSQHLITPTQRGIARGNLGIGLPHRVSRRPQKLPCQ